MLDWKAVQPRTTLKAEARMQNCQEKHNSDPTSVRLLSQRDSWSEGNCILELQMDFSASIYPSIHHFRNSFVLLVSKVFCDNENHNLLNNNILSTILRFCMLTLLPDNFLKGLIVFMSLEIINKHSLFILFKPFTIL